MPSWEAWEPEEAETAISGQAGDRRSTRCSLQCRTESKTAKRKMSFHLPELQCPTQQKSWRPSLHVSPPQSRVMAGKEKCEEAGTFFFIQCCEQTPIWIPLRVWKGQDLNIVSFTGSSCDFKFSIISHMGLGLGQGEGRRHMRENGRGLERRG